MLCNFCGAHRSEPHTDGCPDDRKNTKTNPVLVQLFHRGFKAGIEGHQVIDTHPTIMLGHAQAIRMKQGVSLLD